MAHTIVLFVHKKTPRLSGGSKIGFCRCGIKKILHSFKIEMRPVSCKRKNEWRTLRRELQ